MYMYMYYDPKNTIMLSSLPALDFVSVSPFVEDADLYIHK
jgi:hypothetical protein